MSLWVNRTHDGTTPGRFDFSNNAFTGTVPSVFACAAANDELTSRYVWLNLDNNQLTSLPASNTYSTEEHSRFEERFLAGLSADFGAVSAPRPRV